MPTTSHRATSPRSRTVRMTRNLAAETLRRNAAESLDLQAVILSDQSARGPDPEESGIIADHARRVRAALGQVPVEERRARWDQPIMQTVVPGRQPIGT
jgi:DNA-directed RNA polymerase specialized sigma24 family protein